MKDHKKRLYELGTFVQFIYHKKRYRTICPIKEKFVDRRFAVKKREVLDLRTNKAVRLPYYSQVSVISEFHESSEKKN